MVHSRRKKVYYWTSDELIASVVVEFKVYSIVFRHLAAEMQAHKNYELAESCPNSLLRSHGANGARISEAHNKEREVPARPPQGCARQPSAYVPETPTRTTTKSFRPSLIGQAQ